MLSWCKSPAAQLSSQCTQARTVRSTDFIICLQHMFSLFPPRTFLGRWHELEMKGIFIGGGDRETTALCFVLGTHGWSITHIVINNENQLPLYISHTGLIKRMWVCAIILFMHLFSLSQFWYSTADVRQSNPEVRLDSGVIYLQMVIPKNINYTVRWSLCNMPYTIPLMLTVRF